MLRACTGHCFIQAQQVMQASMSMEVLASGATAPAGQTVAHCPHWTQASLTVMKSTDHRTVFRCDG